MSTVDRPAQCMSNSRWQRQPNGQQKKVNFEFRAASFELDQNESIHRIEDRNRGEFAGYTQEKTLNFRESVNSVVVSVLDGSAPPSSNVFVMSNNTKGILFGGGARRVVVERNDEPDIGRDNGRIAGALSHWRDLSGR